jgi:hypothetical protein
MTHIIKNVTNNIRFYGAALKTYVSKNKTITPFSMKNGTVKMC